MRLNVTSFVYVSSASLVLALLSAMHINCMKGDSASSANTDITLVGTSEDANFAVGSKMLFENSGTGSGDLTIAANYNSQHNNGNLLPGSSTKGDTLKAQSDSQHPIMPENCSTSPSDTPKYLSVGVSGLDDRNGYGCVGSESTDISDVPHADIVPSLSVPDIYASVRKRVNGLVTKEVDKLSTEGDDEPLARKIYEKIDISSGPSNASACGSGVYSEVDRMTTSGNDKFKEGKQCVRFPQQDYPPKESATAKRENGHKMANGDVRSECHYESEDDDRCFAARVLDCIFSKCCITQEYRSREALDYDDRVPYRPSNVVP